MALMTLSTLLIEETKAAIYERGLALATSLGLPVTSWAPGDPTRSLYHFESEILSTLEKVVSAYIAAGFLDWAKEHAERTGNSAWLKLLAKQGFNVVTIEATHASSTLTLTNQGGGLYEWDPGDLTFKNTLTGKTYKNVSALTLAPGIGVTGTIDVEAEEPGSDSSAAADEIDDFVASAFDVAVTASTAAIGLDEESPASIVQRCRDKLGSLSPNGPRDAYDYVAKNPALTGTTAVTRSRSIGDSTTGHVNQYLAGPNGAISGPDRTLVETAIVKWATPLTITPIVASATDVTMNIVYELWLYSSVGLTEDEVKAVVEDDLEELFPERPIGGDIISPATGRIYHSMILSVIRGALPEHTFRAVLTSPSGDTDLDPNEVAKLGTVNGTIHFVEGP